MRTYTVKKNDTLWSIAKAKLGSAERYKEITAANRLLIGTLEPGQKLRLPDQKR